ncbi:Retrovirus-related Pol polyprotein from transposon 297 family [Gossypium australe]|uniref:Retrovirus-related Pol polyprotein from transposon 297 family n=1 Tax=Gossypium australe TaxID=47621 RepID=A0A5B6VN65_9ROSI|nr:Retrovirus-related Pol polyprotein from transposon 297 family [Gossypium australe]
MDKTKKVLQLGLLLLPSNRYYRRFIKNYGAIARPITNLLKKIYDEQATTAFEHLKHALCSALVLTLSNFGLGNSVWTPMLLNMG